MLGTPSYTTLSFETCGSLLKIWALTVWAAQHDFVLTSPLEAALN